MRPVPRYLLWRIGLAHATTQTSAAERDCLVRHATGRKRLVEIGVWEGVTTCRLRAAMSPDAILYGIDPYLPGRLGFSTHERIAHGDVGRLRNGRVEWLRMTGVQAAQKFVEDQQPPVDFIFIDGDHSYQGLRNDWEHWTRLLAPGAIAALHDSRSSATRQIDDAGSAQFTSQIILQDPRFSLAETVDTLTVMRRA